MRRHLILAMIALILSGCVYPGAPVHSAYCKPIMKKLHGGSHRHNMGARVTAINKATLYREAITYKCVSK